MLLGVYSKISSYFGKYFGSDYTKYVITTIYIYKD